jgi:hypothetical protein
MPNSNDTPNSLANAEKPQSRSERLARQILDDRARRAEQASRPQERRERPLGSDFDPFAITKWRTIAASETGTGYLPKTPMRMGKVGFHVACRGCGMEFESKGLAYCPSCLELPAEERHAMKPAVIGRMCQAPGCENFIPRKTRADVVYCSKSCRERAYRARVRTDKSSPLSDTAPPKNGTDNGKKD